MILHNLNDLVVVSHNSCSAVQREKIEVEDAETAEILAQTVATGKFQAVFGIFDVDFLDPIV